MGFYRGINEAIGTIQFKLKHGLIALENPNTYEKGLESIKQAQFALEILEDITAFDICFSDVEEKTEDKE